MLKLVSVKNPFAGDPSSGLSRLLASSSYLSDNELADVIVENCSGADGLSLDVFLDAIPDLQSRPVALDAAIEVTLHSMRRRGAEGAEASEELAGRYPALAAPIRTAYALGEAMINTTSLALANSGRDAVTLPCDVGPLLASGSPRYQLHQLLGVGSQGSVYLGQDRSLSEPGSPAWVAVKHVAPGVAAEEAIRARKVLHPNVVRALDRVPGANGSWMLVFEFVRGGSLERKWGGKTLPDRARAAAELTVQIARGVQAAHSAGLIHRDLKPGNVLLSDDGTPKISDFGISHHQTSVDAPDRSGSLGFMSPEQFRGATPSVQDDVYGLGGLLLWMLTGAYPNGASKELATQNLSGASSGHEAAISKALAGYDEDIAAICKRAIAFDPDDRYASADRLAMDIETWLAHEPIRWTQPSIRRRYRLAVRRSPIAMAGAGLGAVGAVLLIMIAGYLVGNAKVKAERAQIEALSVKNSEQQQRIQSMSMMTALMSNYLRNVSEDNYGANWVHVLTFIESMLGARSSNDPTNSAQMWESRVRVAKNAIAESVARGRGDDIEPLMMESSLCLWLLRAGEGKEALERLDSVEARWRKMLNPDDEWFIFIDVFRTCGRILTVDPNAPDAALQRKTLFVQATEKAKTLGETGRPVAMLLDKLRPIADPASVADAIP